MIAAQIPKLLSSEALFPPRCLFFVTPNAALANIYHRKQTGAEGKKKVCSERWSGRLERHLLRTQENKTTSAGVNDLCLYYTSSPPQPNSPSVDQTGPLGFNKPSYINGHKLPAVVGWEGRQRGMGARRKKRVCLHVSNHPRLINKPGEV